MDNFKIKSNLFFGRDSLCALDEIHDENVLIVCDAFIKKSGMLDNITCHLTNCTISVFDEVVPDPPIEVVSAGIQCLMQCKASILIAVGGGSAIDACKAIRYLAEQKELANIKRCYAIPTTSGTGSEVTQFSVISNKQEGVKYPLIDEALQPTVAILDPELVKSMPPSITADTGMDALTHALEAYVSNDSNDFTDALAEKSITLLMRFLPYAYAHGDDMEAREKVHNASCLAGMAFSMVGLGINHSVAHAIGAKFHIPHGRANAIVLQHSIEFNAHLDSGMETVTARKYQRISKLIGLPYSSVPLAVSSLCSKVRDLNRLFGIPATLEGMDICTEEVEKLRHEMAKAALADPCTKTNPRRPGIEDLELIIDRVKGK
jgi:alcohol dehydrogenase class IV